MAKVKGYMEGNVGKVGNITYYRDSATGETVTRKIVTPKNPKTNAQTVQRVIAKQVGAMYSMMQEIADHSFQGKAKGAQCAAEFRRLNMIAVRDRAAEIQNSGHSLYEYYQAIVGKYGLRRGVPVFCKMQLLHFAFSGAFARRYNR